jgi:queuine/archaeosine tRNA-ribosyltransferase
MIRLMNEIRAAIVDGTFAAYREAFLTEYKITDQAVRHQQAEARMKAKQAKVAAK